MEPGNESSAHDRLVGCLLQVVWFLVLMAIFIVFSLGLLAGIVIASGL